MRSFSSIELGENVLTGGVVEDTISEDRTRTDSRLRSEVRKVESLDGV